MTQIIDPLVQDLVAWCASGRRSYIEVLDAWRSSCPRLLVWEECVARGLLETRPSPGGLVVVVTQQGRSWLQKLPGKAGGPAEPPRAAVARVVPARQSLSRTARPSV